MESSLLLCSCTCCFSCPDHVLRSWPRVLATSAGAFGEEPGRRSRGRAPSLGYAVWLLQWLMHTDAIAHRQESNGPCKHMGRNPRRWWHPTVWSDGRRVRCLQKLLALPTITPNPIEAKLGFILHVNKWKYPPPLL